MKGAFLDGRLQLNPTLFLATYDDFQARQARIADGAVEPGMGTGRMGLDLGGEDLNNSPDLKFTVSAERLLPWEDLPFDGFVNLSLQWQDDLNFSLLGDPGAEQDAYGIANLSLGIVDSVSERYSVALFVHNLFDEDYVSGIAILGAPLRERPDVPPNLAQRCRTPCGLTIGHPLLE